MFGTSIQHKMRMELALCRQIAPIAANHLHEQQAGIGIGDAFLLLATWFRPIPKRFIGFGLVTDPKSQVGFSNGVIAQAQSSLNDLLADNILLAAMGKHVNGKSSGEPVVTHRIWCWPIDLGVYAAGLDVHWNVEAMEPTARAHVSIALQAYEAHKQMCGQAGVIL